MGWLDDQFAMTKRIGQVVQPVIRPETVGLAVMALPLKDKGPIISASIYREW